MKNTLLKGICTALLTALVGAGVKILLDLLIGEAINYYDSATFGVALGIIGFAEIIFMDKAKVAIYENKEDSKKKVFSYKMTNCAIWFVVMAIQSIISDYICYRKVGLLDIVFAAVAGVIFAVLAFVYFGKYCEQVFKEKEGN